MHFSGQSVKKCISIVFQAVRTRQERSRLGSDLTLSQHCVCSTIIKDKEPEHTKPECRCTSSTRVSMLKSRFAVCVRTQKRGPEHLKTGRLTCSNAHHTKIKSLLSRTPTQNSLSLLATTDYRPDISHQAHLTAATRSTATLAARTPSASGARHKTQDTRRNTHTHVCESESESEDGVRARALAPLDGRPRLLRVCSSLSPVSIFPRSACAA